MTVLGSDTRQEVSNTTTVPYRRIGQIKYSHYDTTVASGACNEGRKITNDVSRLLRDRGQQLMMKSAVAAIALAFILVGCQPDAITGQPSAGAAAAVVGRVSDPRGAPVSGATVRLTDEEGVDVQRQMFAVVTGADGGFRVEAPPGRYLLEVIADGYVSARIPVTVIPGGTTGQNVVLRHSR
jgi:hypothetical protein